MMPVRRGRGFGILVEVDAAARLRLNQPVPMSDIQLSLAGIAPCRRTTLGLSLSPAGNLDVTRRRRMIVMGTAPVRRISDS
jgi:hypothetical protein